MASVGPVHGDLVAGEDVTVVTKSAEDHTDYPTVGEDEVAARLEAGEEAINARLQVGNRFSFWGGEGVELQEVLLYGGFEVFPCGAFDAAEVEFSEAVVGVWVSPRESCCLCGAA